MKNAKRVVSGSARALAATAILLAGSSVAFAGNFYVTPQVGWVATDSSREADLGVEDGLSGRLILGYTLTPNVAIEAMVFSAALEANNDQEKGQNGGGLGLRLQPLGARGGFWQPHLTFGAGISDVQISSGGRASNPMVEVGVGSSFDLGIVDLRTDIRYRLERDDDSLPLLEDHFGDVEFALGLTYEFGKTKSAPVRHGNLRSSAPAVPKQPSEPVIAPPVVVAQPVDTDQDGVLDTEDACPNSASAMVNANGCPLQVQEEMCRAHFWVNSASITNYSGNILEACLAKIQEEFAAVNGRAQIVLQGVSDPTGDYAKNLRLAEKRAQAVEQFFVNRGITFKQLVLEPAKVGASQSRSKEALKQLRRVEVWLAR